MTHETRDKRDETAEHTPLPWHVDAEALAVLDGERYDQTAKAVVIRASYRGYRVAETFAGFVGEGAFERPALANARLIVRSVNLLPEALEALRHAATQLDERHWPDKELHEPWEETVARARAVLAKADGRE